MMTPDQESETIVPTIDTRVPAPLPLTPTTRELAAVLGCDYQTVHRAKKSGALVCLPRTGASDQFTPDSVTAYLRERGYEPRFYDRLTQRPVDPASGTFL